MLTEQRVLEVFNAMGTDKGKTHGYHKYYADILNTNPKSLLEIGVKEGKSLAAWRALCPAIELYGLDITNKAFDKEYLNYAAVKPVVLSSLIQSTTGNFPSVDVIIDDGSHFYKDQMTTFKVFKGKFKSVYVIEDVLYKVDEIVEFIKGLGFTDVQVLPSKQKGVLVDKNFLENNSKEKTGENISIDLMMIIVRK